MSETKLYGILCSNGWVSQRRFDIDEDADQLAPYDTERVVEIVAVKKDRLRALESLVRAADRMATHDRLFRTDESADDLDNYRTQRAAVGEIEEE